MCSAAVLVPALGGRNWTVKVVLLVGARGARGLAVTLNIATSGPSNVIVRGVRGPVPALLTVNVRLTGYPTTVTNCGAVPPLTMFVVDIDTAIAAKGGRGG